LEWDENIIVKNYNMVMMIKRVTGVVAAKNLPLETYLLEASFFFLCMKYDVE
jgi:hypothetical protein